MATGISKTKWVGLNSTLENSAEPKQNSNVTLSYDGKQSETEILKTLPVQTSEVWRSIMNTTKPVENRLYYGDNLPILASLLNDFSIAGKIRLIYIDPPFATKSVFQSRSQDNAYCDLLSGGQYLEFLRQRIVLLKELLAEDGSIYIHLDENMAFHVKVIMDEIFGRNNFRNFITRKKCNPKNYTRKTYGNVSDYILFYTKSDKYVWNRPHIDWTSETALKEYSNVEAETGRRYKKVPVHAPGVRNGETGRDWRGVPPPPGKHWQYTPDKLNAMDERGEIYWSPNGNPRRKVYFDESQGIAVQDIWLDFKDAHNQNIKITGYPTEKNAAMLARIIEASSNKNDLVLDCFSGSGTTLDAASQLERRWIGIDNSSEAVSTILKRFCKGVEAMGDFVGKRSGKINISRKLLEENSTPDFALYSTAEKIAKCENIINSTL